MGGDTERDKEAYGDGDSSDGKQLSTSDLMQTDVDAYPDPVTLGKNDSHQMRMKQPGGSYLNTSEDGTSDIP